MTQPPGVSQIRVQIKEHYTHREFPNAAIAYLLSEIDRGIDSTNKTIIGVGDTKFMEKDPDTGEYTVASPLPVSSLGRKFPRLTHIPRTADSLCEVQAIYAFAFGYRLKQGCTAGESTAADRLPGPNNRALASIAARLKNRLQIPLFAQFEIADAIDGCMNTSADCVSPISDIGTKEVIEAFLADAEKPERVIVVAHLHHVGRCCLLLEEEFGIKSIPSVESYSAYDPDEAQKRVKNAESYIVSDFVSMATR